jgi:nitronate monooxygenase
LGAPALKERILAASEFDNRVVMKIFRRHHRVLDNEAARSVEDLEARGVADFEAYRPLVTGRVTREAYETGDLSQGMLDLGPGGVFAREIKPVEAIFDELIDEAGSAIDRLERLGAPL